MDCYCSFNGCAAACDEALLLLLRGRDSLSRPASRELERKKAGEEDTERRLERKTHRRRLLPQFAADNDGCYGLVLGRPNALGRKRFRVRHGVQTPPRLSDLLLSLILSSVTRVNRTRMPPRAVSESSKGCALVRAGSGSSCAHNPGSARRSWAWTHPMRVSLRWRLLRRNFGKQRPPKGLKRCRPSAGQTPTLPACPAGQP